jgi:hypothetical protein
MYVRIARFEGVDAQRIDAFEDELRGQIDAMRRGEQAEGVPESSASALRQHVTRVMDLADRDAATTMALVFCDSEEGAKRVDEALDAMSPGEGGGQRTSAEIYEVVLDESLK